MLLRLRDRHRRRGARARASSRCFASFSSAWSCLRGVLAVGEALLAARELDQLRARAPPPSRARRSSARATWLRRSCTSASISARSLTASSRASTLRLAAHRLRLALRVLRAAAGACAAPCRTGTRRPCGWRPRPATPPTRSPISIPAATSTAHLLGWAPARGSRIWRSRTVARRRHESCYSSTSLSESRSVDVVSLGGSLVGFGNRLCAGKSSNSERSSYALVTLESQSHAARATPPPLRREAFAARSRFGLERGDRILATGGPACSRSARMYASP